MSMRGVPFNSRIDYISFFEGGLTLKMDVQNRLTQLRTKRGLGASQLAAAAVLADRRSTPLSLAPKTLTKLALLYHLG
jgi:hypothetical protein